MGVDTTRRPLLPAPTESIVDTPTGGSATATDLATDISRRTDKTSYSIPDDGSPITIPVRRRPARDEPGKLSRSTHHSQTSLLIEYFEGGKSSAGGLSSRPSVRVRVTPSAARKLKDKSDHIQITESGGSRKPAFTRRISLTSPSKQKQVIDAAAGDDQSVGSSVSAADDGRRPPLEIEFVHRDQGSELSGISSMPPDSMLDGPSVAAVPRRKRSQSLERSDVAEPKDLLKTPSRQRSRSLSTERIAHRVSEKLTGSPREVSSAGKQRRSEKTRAGTKGYLDVDSKTSRRRTRGLKDDEPPSVESSLLSGSGVSSQRRSDQYSIRSGTSKSSINNPRLLETVEDAIRRLILPELKELKKDQKVVSNRSKFERDANASHSSAGSTGTSRDDAGRRLSKHASAPDVMPQVVLNRDSHDDGIVLTEEPQSTNEREHRTSSKGSESRTEQAYAVRANRPDLTESDKIRRQKSKGLRDAAAAGIVGTALTAAALRHHDSKSSLDSKDSGRRRRSRRSDRRRSSGTASVNDTELVFERHHVAPMPLRSAVDSDLTRESILSQHTADPASAEAAMHVREVVRGSPRHSASAGSRTPTRRPVGGRDDLGVHHTNLSSRDLPMDDAREGELHADHRSSMGDAAAEMAASAIAAAATANLLDGHSAQRGDGSYDDGPEYEAHAKHRALSPIQSVASDHTETHHEQVTAFSDHRGVLPRDGEPAQRLSIESLSSAPSTDLARSTRQEAVSLDSRGDGVKPHDEFGPELGYEDSPRASRDVNWHEHERDGVHGDEVHSRDSPFVEARRMTNYTDDSELDYIAKINQGQHVADVGVASPEFVHPVAVESAVASLLDPSVVDSKSTQSGGRSQSDLVDKFGDRRDDTTTRDLPTSPLRRESPVKYHQQQQRMDAASPDATSFPKRMGMTSPPQSVAQSFDEQQEEADHLAADQFHGGSVSPDDPDHDESESEINTNPSIIQGPIGGISHENRDHWPYEPTPPKADHAGFRDAMAAGAGAGLGLAAGREYYPHATAAGGDNTYMANGPAYATPPGAKDEGYVSAANPRSPSVDTPKPGTKVGGGGGYYDATPEFGMFDSPDDPFVSSHQRHLSGYSHGISSPLYDSATGGGIERIQSKDIIALMEHLMVRDAQRNARDTEILVTLVRSAAEMRNSFEEMKKFIAHQDELLVEAGDKQHERTQRAIGGPRPQPFSASKSSRQMTMSTDEGEELRTKRRNVFRRALKGLSLKSSHDLTKIEEMLEQLLGEVEALRAAQEGSGAGAGGNGPPPPRPRSSNGNGGAWAATVDPDGYEPEGRAGTASTPDRSGYLSNSSRQAYDGRGSGNGPRRDLDGRVSTVHEVDEDMDLDEREEFLSPLGGPTLMRHERAGSLPLTTPTRATAAPTVGGSFSNETTPKTAAAADKARKHKSSSSSFFPKISRWSKTTASSVGDNIRNSLQPGRKDRPFSYASRSGSDLANNEPYRTTDYYDPQGDDRLRSSATLDEQHQHQQQENRPPSPLVPSQVSEAPKYRAHRGSLDLQHPQPRQGPTGRYQTQWESQAQNFHSPISPNSDQWAAGSNPSLGARTSPSHHRYSGGGRLTPISDRGYSDATPTNNQRGQAPPPRPPKVKDDGPLVPERPPKIKEDENQQSYAERMVRGSAAVRSSPQHNTPPTRKPTGPRPLTTTSSSSAQNNNNNALGNVKRTRYRGSPDHLDDDDDDHDDYDDDGY